jgi:hypothetical protein
VTVGLFVLIPFPGLFASYTAYSILASKSQSLDRLLYCLKVFWHGLSIEAEIISRASVALGGTCHANKGGVGGGGGAE